METAAQILGVVGIAMSFFIYIARKRSSILLCKFSCDVIWAAHYFLIGAWSGAALNVLAMARETVFFNKDKKWASSKLWMYLFAGLTLLSGILTWEGPSSLLPAVGSVCAVISFWCTKPLNIRLLAIPAQGLWTIYNIIHRSLTGGISSGLQLISVLLGLARDLREMKVQKSAGK